MALAQAPLFRSETARKLRDYQDICVNETLKVALGEGDRKCYYHLPTGCGKTRVAAGLIEHLAMRGRVIFLAHRKELIEQGAASLRQDLPGLSVGVVMAERNELQSQIFVASVQTLSSGDRLSRLLTAVLAQQDDHMGPLAAILIDECHHVTPGSKYADIIETIRSVYPRCAVVGCTATPYRADASVMQEVLPVCTFSRTIQDMQTSGWLADVTWRPLHVDFFLDPKKVSYAGGERDYAPAMIEEAQQEKLAEIVTRTIPEIGDRPAVVFAATVNQAQAVALLYQQAGIRAAAIWGEMPKPERQRILTAWKRLDYQLVVNVGILTEGFDYQPIAPNIEGLAAMVILRVTMSPGLYLQMLGRGTRLKPGRYQDCLVIDVAGNANLLESKQLVLPKILEQPVSEDIYGVLEHPELMESLPPVDFSGKADQADEEEDEGDRKKRPIILRNTDPTHRSWISWGRRQNVYFSDFMNGSVVVLRRTDAGLYEGHLFTRGDRYSERRAVSQIYRRALPLHEAMQHVNVLVANNGLRKLLDKGKHWRQEPATPKAIAFLERLNPDIQVRAWTKEEVGQQITWELIKGHLALIGLEVA